MPDNPPLGGVLPGLAGSGQAAPDQVEEFRRRLRAQLPDLPDWAVDNAVVRYLGGSFGQAVKGGQTLFGSNKNLGQRLGGVSDIVRGGGSLALPALAPELLGEDAIFNLARWGVTSAIGSNLESGLKKIGVPEGYAKFVTDLVSIGTTPEKASLGERIPATSLTAKIKPTGPQASAPDEPSASGALRAPVKKRDVKARTLEDLNQRIPQEQRVVSKDPTKTIDGKPFHTLDLESPAEGFLPFRLYGKEKADQMVKQAWSSAVTDSEIEGGSAAREAVQKTGARPPDSGFWHRAFSQPKRARYWYELSGESFTGKHVNVPKAQQPRVIDAMAGTSGGVEPGPNAKRGLGILSEDVQRQPVMTDLRDPVSARKALGPGGPRTLKYGSFSGSMKFTSGLSKEAPLSTNDVQVADMFGLKGEDIGKNPVLYEVISRFLINLRNMQNAHIKPTDQPWETWQMQAPGWVYQRALKNPKKASEYDDYAQEMPKIIKQLQAAGVPTPGGKITMETLRDPRTPNIMSGTREHFLGTPVATIEAATKLTPEGARAADLHDRIMQLDPSTPWVRDARQEYAQIQRNMMSGLMMRKSRNKALGTPEEPSLISQLASVITGQKIDVSRIDRMGYGTFEGQISPNMRVPMTGRRGQKWFDLDPVQREAMLSVLGQEMDQEGMASSHFQYLPEEAKADTYSVFLRRYDGKVNQAAINQFSKQLGRPVNISQTPNGILVDINIEKGSAGPTREQVEDAVHATLRGDQDIKNIKIFGRSYDSNYVSREEYEEKINAWQRQQQETGVHDAGRTGGTRNTPQRVGDLAGVRQKIRSHARVRDEAFGKWTDKYGGKLPQTGAAVTPPL